ncbi:TPA: multidrug ABC transporter substrate-binding protein, partial [Candidatus Sumerlaeota bacterium]|nr:multidrug ABC transporter substrate-binding protein [Candidatus Sumerlaeota bacterium]
MFFWTIVKVAFKSLYANKMRSILAMLGIIIGCGAVIAMLAIGQGTKKKMMDRLSTMGSNLLIVRAGQSASGGIRSGTSQKLKPTDGEAIVKELTGVKAVTPVVQTSAQAKHLNKNAQVTILGCATTYPGIRDYTVEVGRYFNEAEVTHQARVAVIGPVTKTNLFGDSDAVGETIKVKGINFRVIGVLKSKGDQGFFNPDDQIMAPFTTVMKQLQGTKYLREIDIQAEDGYDLTKLQGTVTALVRKLHRITDSADNDFEVRNQAEMVEMMNTVSSNFTWLLGTVAAISLFVGGIGIMNIMLVTVTERTREIGIRKAIGAKDKDILTQFLLEAIIMSGMGGLLGVFFGVGTAALIPLLIPNYMTVVQISSVIMSLSFSGAVG